MKCRWRFWRAKSASWNLASSDEISVLTQSYLNHKTAAHRLAVRRKFLLYCTIRIGCSYRYFDVSRGAVRTVNLSAPSLNFGLGRAVKGCWRPAASRKRIRSPSATPSCTRKSKTTVQARSLSLLTGYRSQAYRSQNVHFPDSQENIIIRKLITLTLLLPRLIKQCVEAFRRARILSAQNGSSAYGGSLPKSQIFLDLVPHTVG